MDRNRREILERLKREKRQRDVREKQAKAEMERMWKEEEEKDLKERKDEDELARLKEERKKKEHRTKAKELEIERLRQERIEKQQREDEQVAQLRELESATKNAATKIEAQSKQVPACLSFFWRAFPPLCFFPVRLVGFPCERASREGTSIAAVVEWGSFQQCSGRFRGTDQHP